MPSTEINMRLEPPLDTILPSSVNLQRLSVCPLSSAWILRCDEIIQWACSHRNESHSECRFGTWFGPFPDLKAWSYPLWTQSSFKSGSWNALLKHEKGAFWIADPPRKPDSEDMWTKSSFGTWFVRAHIGNGRWSHAWVNQHGLRSRNIISSQCADPVCDLGQRLQCIWTHVVQITNPIRKRIAIRNGFRNVIRSFVNRPSDFIKPSCRMHFSLTVNKNTLQRI